MHPIEPLEPRLAPAAGLTVTHLPGGALTFDATEGADSIVIRSDEPGWLTFGVQNADLFIDGKMSTNPAVIPIPTGLVSVNLLGGDDQLFLNPMTLPGSLVVNDPTGASKVAFVGVNVRGALTLNGSSGDDLISIDGSLRVGRDFKAELGGGTSDIIYNQHHGLTFSVGGSFRIHGTATTTAVALGLDITAAPARDIADPLSLRDLRVGGDVTFESPGSNVGLLFGSAATHIGGSVVARATGAGGHLDFFQKNSGPLVIGRGLRLEADSGSNTYLEASDLRIAGSFSVAGGTGNDTCNLYGNDNMSLPRTSLVFGDGSSDTTFQGHEHWTLGGTLSVTGGTGDDKLQLRGVGRIIGNVTGDFGVGIGTVVVEGEGGGRMMLGPLLKLTAQTQIVVGLYNAVLPGRVEITGHGGDDSVRFDSVRVTGPVVFTGSAGADGFLVDDTAVGYVTPSVFLGPVTADLGDGADGVILGADNQAGHATFFGSATFKGIDGETYDDVGAPNVVFKTKPVLS